MSTVVTMVNEATSSECIIILKVRKLSMFNSMNLYSLVDSYWSINYMHVTDLLSYKGE